MSKYSQKDAVYQAVKVYLEEQGRPFEDGDVVILSSDDRKTVVSMIVGAIQAGSVEFSEEACAKHDTTEKIRNYTTGLLSNWLRKDNRLNGGIQHVIKHPGARAGQDDDLVKKLKALRRLLSRRIDMIKVDSEIQRRLQQISAEKVPDSLFKKEFIPEHLKHLVK